ncbi:MAG: hypothetical protein M3Z25_23825 [Actinomycetota bacterium]|nr:hypothetical protein [Actinomycetota bacterium]
MASGDADCSPELLRECPGFGRVWTAAAVSGFGSYVTTLAIQVLIVVTLHETAAGVGLVSSAAGFPTCCSAWSSAFSSTVPDDVLC